jgi:hypothetical protein
MVNMGTCPKCDKVLGHVTLVEISAGEFFGNQWRAIKYCCPFCYVILSVQIDPVALKTDTIDGTVAALRGR